MPPGLELIDLRRRFGDVLALDGVSLRVDEGTVVGFVGPNGAGKTTAMRIALGVLATDGGEVLARPARRRAGLAAVRLHPRGAWAVSQDARARPARVPRGCTA